MRELPQQLPYIWTVWSPRIDHLMTPAPWHKQFAPENWRFKDYISFGLAYFQVLCFGFLGTVYLIGSMYIWKYMVYVIIPTFEMKITYIVGTKIYTVYYWSYRFVKQVCNSFHLPGRNGTQQKLGGFNPFWQKNSQQGNFPQAEVTL